MVTIDIAKENQIKNKAKKFRNSVTFSELMSYNPVEAAQYAIDCGIKTKIYGVPAEEFVKNNGVISKKEEKKLNIEDTGAKTGEEFKDEGNGEETGGNGEETVNLTKEDIQELLKSHGIEFKKTLGLAKLVELAKENNLLQ